MLGQSVTAELAAGATGVYRLTLESNVFFRVRVDQLGVDVDVRVFDPEDRLLIRYDRLGTVKPEQVMWITDAPGSYRLEIAALRVKRTASAYSVTLEELRPASMADSKRVDAERLLAEGEALRRESAPESWREAAVRMRQAIGLWHAIGDHTRQVEGLYRLSLAQGRWDRREAIATLETALDLLDANADTDSWHSAVVLHRLGLLHSQQGKLRQAVELYERALPFRERIGDVRGEILTLNRLGLACKMMGELPEALTHYRLALKHALELQDPEQQARAQHNLGKALLSTGMVQEALDSLTRALEIREDIAAPDDVASTLNAIGQTLLKAGQPRQALDTQLRALALSRAAEDRNLEALALTDTGQAYLELERWDDALQLFEKASAIYLDLGHRSNQANALHNIGRVRDAMDQDARAADYYRQALALYEATEHRPGRIMTLFSLALVERQNGDLTNARQHLEAALGEIERLRAKPLGHALRTSYFASKLGYYEIYVDLLMELHRRRPDGGYDAEALTASERARARSQLDALVESGIDLQRGAAPALLERDQTLEEDIAALEIQRQELFESGAGERRLAAVERRLRALFLEHDRVLEDIRIANPQYAALTQPRPLTTKEIQRQVLDSETLLLEYSLGTERSYLWAVTSDELSSFELPPREVIEKTAKRAYKLLISSHLTASRVQTEVSLAKLSKQLLHPVAELLEGKRLVIVADGALQYIPFGVLPEPQIGGAGGKPTIEGPPVAASHEIISLPSASTLAVLRGQIEGRQRPSGTVAVFADPVFELDDPRFKKRPSDTLPSAVRGQATPEPRRFERLIYSRREADYILSLVPAESSFAAIGYGADRESVIRGPLGDYRFLHFATHGVLNTAHPGWSRLVLSQLDRRGQKVDGHLFAHEIYNLELAADLVVLSACETALGAEIRGEGLLGLTQGFMYAGAASVLVSLWNVDDQATAELMAAFYRKLLVEKQRPAAALRTAQVTIRKEKKWQAPYYWAGFVLQGDWR